mgnify:CR=1 FL=1
MAKQDWVKSIDAILARGEIFCHRTQESNKAPLLFAADVFRRLNYGVNIAIEPTQYQKAALVVIIHPTKCNFEYTLKRNDNPMDIIEEIYTNPVITTISIRGCGTVINSLFTIIDWSIHNGWYVEKTFMNTLTQTLPSQTKQRNTTMSIVLCRGSDVSTI